MSQVFGVLAIAMLPASVINNLSLHHLNSLAELSQSLLPEIHLLLQTLHSPDFLLTLLALLSFIFSILFLFLASKCWRIPRLRS